MQVQMLMLLLDGLSQLRLAVFTVSINAADTLPMSVRLHVCVCVSAAVFACLSLVSAEGVSAPVCVHVCIFILFVCQCTIKGICKCMHRDSVFSPSFASSFA